MLVWLNLVYVFRNLGAKLNLGKIRVFLHNMYESLKLDRFKLQPLYATRVTKT